MRNKERLLVALKTLKNTGPEYTGLGICTNVEKLLNVTGKTKDQIWDIMERLFKSWPQGTGSVAFPVKSTCRGKTSLGMYYGTSKKWAKNTKYGKSRWALVDWMIEQLEKELANGHQ